ncbi:hypothetical protein [Sphaerisporangium dianthi]|uniref:SMI1/KNR4 family protein n=1 Tax=Sphaerisporangium dianthi TaxID=1436120 RepID=A0ABV9C8Z2_9ACTN
MSEHQHYEFAAIDRPLTAAEQTEVRALSPGAQVTATSFTADHEPDDFGGDPARMMERYYDAHVYVTGWGVNQVMLRLPEKLLDLATVEPYLVDELFEGWVTDDEHLILDLRNEDEEAGLAESPPEGWLTAVSGVRAELASGDSRPLYLAWLAAVGTWERDEDAFDEDMEDELEPPVPAGLRSLTAAQRALAAFLRLDADLLATAATAAPELPAGRDDPAGLARWIERLPEEDKNALLLRAARGDDAPVRMELLGRFHRETGAPSGGEDAGAYGESGGEGARRTVAELLDATATARQERGRHRTADQA